MLTGNELTALLHSVSTGYVERAVNLVNTTENLETTMRERLAEAINQGSTAEQIAQALGDELVAVGADQFLVNECYRCAFYAGDHWEQLSDNPLFAWFTANRAGPVLDKWVHYFPIYAHHLARYRDSPVRVLEIGVYRGGGLSLLAHYLGPRAQLVGLDVDEAAVRAVGDRFPVALGDQEDPEVLRRLSESYGPFDIVIDDGGHTMAQQIASVETLFPLLAEGGTYLVEDTHTSYWTDFGGAEPGASGTFLAWARGRVDDLHARHHREIDRASIWATTLAGLHVYDSVVVLDKERRFRPFNEIAGSSSYLFGDRFSEGLSTEILATRDAVLAERDQLQSQLAAAQSSIHAQEDLRLVRAELRQLRAQEAEAAVQAAAERAELERTRGQLLESWEQIRAMRSTVSWRLTRPLRGVRRFLR